MCKKQTNTKMKKEDNMADDFGAILAKKLHIKKNYDNYITFIEYDE